MNRAQQPRANVPNSAHPVANPVAPVSPVQTQNNRAKNNNDKDKVGKWLRIATTTLLFSLTVLLVASAAYIGFKGTDTQASKYVNKNEYQAVFINISGTGTTGEQVYFGHIQNITSQYIDLTNVFYIQSQPASSSTTSATNTLVKLGCELHAPEDQMIVNNSQVLFWENLKPSGQVSTKIAQWYKQNPSGQCTASSTGTQGTTTPTTTPSTTPTTNDTTKK